MKNIFIYLTFCLAINASAQVIVKVAPTGVNDVMQKKAKEKKLLYTKTTTAEYKDGYWLQSDASRTKNIYASVLMSKAKNVPYAVYGAIAEYYCLNGANIEENGYPIMDEKPMKNGSYQLFDKKAIFWSPTIGVHELHGDIMRKWQALGSENSFLGFPVTNETATPDGYGRFNFFEGGAIYYHPNLGTFSVPKMIAEVWKKEGWEKGKLGYPISDEIIKNNNSVQKFEFGAVISAKGGAYQVIYNGDKKSRGLYSKWLETGAENSYLGDLVTPNRSYPKNQYQYFAEFQKGYIYESFIKGTNKIDAFVIRKGPIFDYYASKKWEQGYLGLPISDEQSSKKSVEELREQVFQGGVIYYTQSMGAFEKKK